MTGARRRIAQGLVATIVVCAVAFMVCGSFASPGNVYEQACVVLVAVMFAALAAALALAAATYVVLRAAVRRRLGRPVLTDEEFLARLPGGCGCVADPACVGQIRGLAAQAFQRLGGARFYPDDRLEEDLHLSDLAPFAARRFCTALEQTLGLDEDALAGRFARRPQATFGELVQTAAALAEAARPSTEEIHRR